PTVSCSNLAECGEGIWIARCFYAKFSRNGLEIPYDVERYLDQMLEIINAHGAQATFFWLEWMVFGKLYHCR
ncbi:MAG: hypothetical protein HOC71_12505, partial [Candidatus Latescibacteria bacterium]|nr:hypothetical protein [Candidatus Latescibacterota bacterium]